MRPHIVDFPKSFPPVPTEVVRQIEPIVPGAGRTEERSVVEVTWCRHTESRVLVHINGIEVTDHGTFNDYYGFLTSIREAQEVMDGYVGRYRAGPGDRFEVSILSWIEDVPTFGFSHRNFNRDYYRLVGDSSALFIDVPEGGLAAVKPGDFRTLRTICHSATKVSSSVWSAEENAAAAAAFRARAGEDVRTVGEEFGS